MKVFFINTNKAWGGGEKWHFETACSLKDLGHEVAILSSPETELYKRCQSAGVRTVPVVITNLSFLNPFRINSLKRFLKAEAPGTVILNLSSDLKTAGIAAHRAGIRNIIYRRGNAKPVKNSIFNRLIFGKIVTGIIANSEETKRSILKNNENLFPVDKIKVLYNGIDMKKFDGLPATKMYPGKKCHVILGSAGRLSHEKGQHLLVDLASVLSKRQVPYIFLIAGDGPMKKSLMDRFAETGLDKQVVFLGFVENIKAFMETIDIFILPSLWEGFGYVSIEAMVCSKPVVAFHTGSNPEIIENKVTGFLVSCFDTGELADRICDLIHDPLMRENFGKAGRKKVEELFNVNYTGHATMRYLASLCN